MAFRVICVTNHCHLPRHFWLSLARPGRYTDFWLDPGAELEAADIDWGIYKVHVWDGNTWHWDRANDFSEVRDVQAD